LEHAIELKVCLVNWHINAPVPGISCNGRALGLKEICKMVVAYVMNSKSKEKVADEVDIVPWDQGMDMYIMCMGITCLIHHCAEHQILHPSHVQWKKIPLVVAEGGKVLALVKHCSKGTQMLAGKCSRQKASDEKSDEESDNVETGQSQVEGDPNVEHTNCSLCGLCVSATLWCLLLLCIVVIDSSIEPASPMSLFFSF
jgi:hypothetical protein